MKKNLHVVPKGKEWAVKTENSSKAYRVVSTQKEAIEIGRQVAINNKSELIIHNSIGVIRQKNSYGNDNHPPIG